MNEDTARRMNQIYENIENRVFKSKIHAGAEIEFYIFDYPADVELEIRDHTKAVLGQLAAHYPNKKVIEVNLFAMLLELLKSRKLLDKAIKMQTNKSNDAVLKALKGPLSEKKVGEFLVKKYKDKNADLIFLTGVGSAWPLLKSHTLLNNLQVALDGTPLVVFYPGDYDGKSLTLFSTIKNTNYYRAHRLVS
jgi:hypothetical protein